MADFHNYKNKNRSFDSFNGTELKCYMKVPTKYDEYGQMSKFELVELGNISGISAVEQFSAEPVPAIGFSRPIGISVGSSLVTGSLSFETLKSGFVNEVTEILKKAGVLNISLIIGGKDGVYSMRKDQLKEINDFPLVDIVILGVKENDMNKQISKEIQGIRFNKGGSGIGLSQLGVREQYQFLAQSVTDFQPVLGVSEEEEGEAKNLNSERYIFS